MIPNPFILAECKRLELPLNKIETPLAESYSQCGEDLIVESLLLAILSRRPPVDNIFYIEIGANHPIQTSNTYLFYRKYRSHGVLVEADPNLIPALKKARPYDEVIHSAVSAREAETVLLNVAEAKELSSLDAEHIATFPKEWSQIVRQIEVKNTHIRDLLAPYEEIMYLSIDVEGLDLEILSAIDFTKHRPWIISCEPSPQYKKESPSKIYQHMAANGYLLAARNDVNLIFADQRLI